MEADLSGRHSQLEAFGCPMYFQAKSPHFTQISIDSVNQRQKPFLYSVWQRPPFIQIPSKCSQTLIFPLLVLGNTHIGKHFSLTNYFLPPPHMLHTFYCVQLSSYPSQRYLQTHRKSALSLCAVTSDQVHITTFPLFIPTCKNQTSSELTQPRHLKLSTQRSYLFVMKVNTHKSYQSQKAFENWDILQPFQPRFPIRPQTQTSIDNLSCTHPANSTSLNHTK